MSLGTLTEQFYLKDDLQFDPAQVTCRCALSILTFSQSCFLTPDMSEGCTSLF